MKGRAYIALVMCLALIACQKDEIPIDYTPLANNGSNEGPIATELVNQIIYGEDYEFRIYYDIETDSIVGQHTKMDFDLAMAYDEVIGEWTIELNNSRLMRVFVDSVNAFDDIVEMQGEGPFFDEPDASVLAIDAQDYTSTYLLDTGSDMSGNPLDSYKLQVLDSDNSAELTLRYAKLGEEAQTRTIQPDPLRNFVHLDFEEGIKVIEPPKEDWDILFTHYTRIFEDFAGFPDPIPYLISGAMLNPYQTEAVKLEGEDFDTLDRDLLDAQLWSSARDAIGFDWKTFDISTATYTLADYSYGIRTAQGNTYKWRFLGFYDSQGNTGAPSFQAVLLPE